MINKFKSPLGMTEFVFFNKTNFWFCKVIFFFFLNANLSAEIIYFLLYCVVLTININPFSYTVCIPSLNVLYFNSGNNSSRILLVSP